MRVLTAAVGLGGPEPLAHRGDPAVERRALLEWPTEGIDDRVEIAVVELLAVARARGPRDVLVHQRAAEVVAPGEQRLASAIETGLRPRDLHVVDPAAVGDPADRVHEEHLAHGGPTARPLLEVDRAGHVHERERHELGEAAGLLLQRPRAHEVAGDVHRALDRAEHDRDVGAQADRMGKPVGLEPLLGVHLVGADDRPHLVVEDLGGGAGQRREPGVLREREVVAERHAEAAGALGDLERGEPVQVDGGRGRFHRSCHRQVVLAVEVGMDAALEADLGGAALDGFDDPALDLLEVEQVRRPAEVERHRALRERAELALERADVRVVDVAGSHEGDDVADGVGAELIGDRSDTRDVGTTRAEQRDDLVDADFLACCDAVEHVAHG